MTEPHLINKVTKERIELPLDGKLLQIGRGSTCDLFIPDQSVSREQAKIQNRGGEFTIIQLSKNTPTAVNGQELGSELILKDGDIITIAGSSFIVMIGGAENINDAGVFATEFQDVDRGPGRIAPPRDFIIIKSGVIGRNPKSAYPLDHPWVSWTHAKITLEGGKVRVADAGSTNGTFVNHRKIYKSTTLVIGDRVEIGPFSLEFLGDKFVAASCEGNIRLIASGLTCFSGGGSDGAAGPPILDDVSLVIPPRHFVAILGPSGSGKSTLLNALSARRPADQGVVFFNKASLYNNFDLLKQNIAVVPQHDVLHEELPLAEAVAFTAKLRLPGDTHPEETNKIVERSLSRVGILDRARMEIRKLSGGQRRRASLANETVNEPNILFADEVTSGLDEQTDWEIMKLLREAADRGVTVVCVTHSLVNIEEFCHRIVVLASPGVLAFFGTPAEALAYFEVPRLSDIYKKLRQAEGRVWKAKFKKSELYDRYVAGELRSVGNEHASGERLGTSGRPNESIRQFKILCRRALRLLFIEKRTLYISLAQAVVVGAILSFAFSDGAEKGAGSNTTFGFLLGISCYWFGCNNASKEIVKERHIYLRERDVNLSAGAYFLSKVVILAALGIAQVFLLYFIVHFCAFLPGRSAQIIIIMLQSVLAGTSVGMLISAASSTRDQATSLVPLALIPQIILSNFITPLSGFIKFISQLAISSSWIYEAIGAECEQRAGLFTGRTFAKPYESLSWLAAHTVAFGVAAFFVLLINGRDGKSWLRAFTKGGRG